MNPSMLRWTFGDMYVALVFCLPSLSLLYFFVLFLLIWEFSVVGKFANRKSRDLVAVQGEA